MRNRLGLELHVGEGEADLGRSACSQVRGRGGRGGRGRVMPVVAIEDSIMFAVRGGRAGQD